MTKWIYCEKRYGDGTLAAGYRYDNELRGEILTVNGWVASESFFHKLIRGDNALRQLEGIPEWAIDEQGRLKE
jgi:hypothetical protein